MPYIKKDQRVRLETFSPENCGELNYKITALIHNYILANGGISYAKINEAIGVLECTKLELYRKVAGRYEDQKAIENGSVTTLDK